MRFPSMWHFDMCGLRLASAVHVSASSQSLRFILSLRLSRPGYRVNSDFVKLFNFSGIRFIIAFVRTFSILFSF